MRGSYYQRNNIRLPLPDCTRGAQDNLDIIAGYDYENHPLGEMAFHNADWFLNHHIFIWPEFTSIRLSPMQIETVRYERARLDRHRPKVRRQRPGECIPGPLPDDMRVSHEYSSWAPVTTLWS